MTSGLRLRAQSAPSCLTDPRRLDALRLAWGHLVASCRERRAPLPPVRLVLTDGAVVQMHLAAPMHGAPTPWRVRGHIWSLTLRDLSRHQRSLGHRSPDAWSVCPALVDLGRFGDWSVLVDVASAPGLIELDGEPGEVQGVLQRIVQELRHAPWSAAGDVVVLGDDVLARLGADPTSLLGPLPAATTPTGATGRTGAAPRGGHRVFVSTRPLAPSVVRHVRLAALRRDAATVIAPGDPSGRGAWRWHVGYGEVTW